jgi:hypothetical protein
VLVHGDIVQQAALFDITLQMAWLANDVSRQHALIGKEVVEGLLAHAAFPFLHALYLHGSDSLKHGWL